MKTIPVQEIVLHNNSISFCPLSHFSTLNFNPVLSNRWNTSSRFLFSSSGGVCCNSNVINLLSTPVRLTKRSKCSRTMLVNADKELFRPCVRRKKAKIPEPKLNDKSWTDCSSAMGIQWQAKWEQSSLHKIFCTTICWAASAIVETRWLCSP